MTNEGTKFSTDANQSCCFAIGRTSSRAPKCHCDKVEYRGSFEDRKRIRTLASRGSSRDALVDWRLPISNPKFPLKGAPLLSKLAYSKPGSFGRSQLINPERGTGQLGHG